MTEESGSPSPPAPDKNGKRPARLFRGRVVFAAWLALVWVLLWEDFSIAAAICGLVVGAALILLFPGPAPHPFRGIRPLKALKFLVYFLYKLIQANLIVAWEVITPPVRINEGVVAVPIQEASDAVVTLIANAISLTPGTLTLEVRRDPPVLYVHVLHLKSVEEARQDILRLERLAREAFGEYATSRRSGTADQPTTSPAAGTRG